MCGWGSAGRVAMGVRRPDRSKATAVPSLPAVQTMSPFVPVKRASMTAPL